MLGHLKIFEKNINIYFRNNFSCSTKRSGLKYRAPYELIDDANEDMRALMDLLKMHLIPADEVHLKPDLLVRKK